MFWKNGNGRERTVEALISAGVDRPGSQLAGDPIDEDARQFVHDVAGVLDRHVVGKKVKEIELVPRFERAMPGDVVAGRRRYLKAFVFRRSQPPAEGEMRC